jgi:MFS family permease
MLVTDSMVLDLRKTETQGGLMAWLVCLSAGLFFLYEFFQLNLFDVINASLRDDFQLDAVQLSWLSSSYVLANILFLLPAGLILDRFSTRRVILMAMMVCVLGTAGFAYTTAFAWAFLFHFLAGIGNAFCFLSCVVLISRWFPLRRQAFLIGCTVTMAFLGGVLAHTPLAYLTQRYGWRAAMWMDAGLGMLIVAWLWMVLRDRPDEGPKAGVDKSQKPRLMSVVLNRQNGLAGLYTACMNLPIMVLCALWGASYLRVVYQLPMMAASNVISLILMGSMLGCPLAGWISDAMGRRKPVMVMGAVATLLTLSPLYMHLTLSATELSVLFFALGFFTSTQVVGYAVVAESNRMQATGLATGIASVVIMVGGGMGQVVFGLLMGAHAAGSSGVERVVDYQFAMGLFPVTLVIALLALGLIRETHCERLAE